MRRDARGAPGGEEEDLEEDLEEVPVPEDVLWVHVFLDGPQHPQADLRDRLPHPRLAELPHWITTHNT